MITTSNGNNNCSGAESGNSCSSGGLLQSTIKDEQCSKYTIIHLYACIIHNIQCALLYMKYYFLFLLFKCKA